MRITNKMMTNNMLYDINGNKKRLDKLDEQYATGLRIQRPSDDPIVAVRALKLRTNLSELNQYFEKNIPDAMSWMETTESAMKMANEIFTKMHTYCVQGANDTLTTDDRRSISVNLDELKQQLHQEGDTNYAGRYVFSGYKTDRSLIFTQPSKNLNYEITEKLTGADIEVVTRVKNTGTFSTDFSLDAPEEYNTDERPTIGTVYRIALSYDELRAVDDGGSLNIAFPELDADGNYLYDDDGALTYSEVITDSAMNVVKSNDSLAYFPEEGGINYIEDTGELILSEDMYKMFRDRDFHITYQKNDFETNDLRPEHYFDCTVTDLSIEDEDEREEAMLVYTKADQKISYEVNFNQVISINTQGSDAIRHKTSRAVDDMLKAISDVDIVERDIEAVKKLLAGSDLDEAAKTKLAEIQENLESELTLKNDVLQRIFSRSLTTVENEQNVMNVALADLGTRYNRLQLTKSRLSDQQTDFTDLLSKNEDADMVETIVKFNSQQTIYNASLSAASKVVKNTLLDFL